MAHVHGIVYDSPKEGFPPLVVVFDPDGEVLVARVVPSIEDGEALLHTVMSEFQQRIDKDLGR